MSASEYRNIMLIGGKSDGQMIKVKKGADHILVSYQPYAVMPEDNIGVSAEIMGKLDSGQYLMDLMYKNYSEMRTGDKVDVIKKALKKRVATCSPGLPPAFGAIIIASSAFFMDGFPISATSTIGGIYLLGFFAGFGNIKKQVKDLT